MRSLWILALAALVALSGCITAPMNETHGANEEPSPPPPVLRSQNDTLEQTVDTGIHPTETNIGPGWTLTFPATLQTLDVILRWTQDANDFRLRASTPQGTPQTYPSSGGSVTIDFDKPVGGTYAFTPRAMGAVLDDTLTLHVSYSWLETPGAEAPRLTPAISVRQEGNHWIAEAVLQGRSSVEDAVEIEIDVMNGAVTLGNSGSEATIYMTVWARAESEARARELVQSLDTSVSVANDALHAIARVGSLQPGSGESVGASADVSVPATVKGLIDSSNGEITLDGVESSGLTVTTSNGAITGSLTSSGDVLLDTSNGEVDLAFTPTASLTFDVETSNGEVQLRLKEGSGIGYSLDAQTSNGEVSEAMNEASLNSEGEDEATLTTSGYSSRPIQVSGLIDTSNAHITFESL